MSYRSILASLLRLNDEEDEVATLKKLAGALDAGTLEEDDKWVAARYLRDLASSPSALRALHRASRGRPFEVRAWISLRLIGMDYAARRQRWNKAAKLTKKDVGRDWGCAPDRVKDAITAFRKHEKGLNDAYNAGVRDGGGDPSKVPQATPKALELDSIIAQLAKYRTTCVRQSRKALRKKVGTK